MVAGAAALDVELVASPTGTCSGDTDAVPDWQPASSRTASAEPATTSRRRAAVMLRMPSFR
jgi:hypothetical protein